MKIVSKIYLSYGLLLVIAVVASFLTLWSARQSEFHLQRTELAHSSYESHLRLSLLSTELINLFAADVITDREDEAQAEALSQGIRAEIILIRRIIGAEIQMVGEEEVEELQHLGTLEVQIEALIDAYNALIDDQRPSFIRWQELNDSLARPNSKSFHTQLKETLAGEIEEIDETREEVQQLSQTYRRWSIFLGCLATIAGLASVALLVRGIRGPIGDLVIGARSFSHGNWQHRIPSQYGGELGDVARAFNATAAAADEREQALIEARANLEDKVAERTEALHAALGKLENEATLRKRLLADVSHELRTPITIIHGEADVALRGNEKAPQEYRDALKKTRDAAKHSAAIVNDLLFVARSEAGDIRLKIANHNLNTIVKDAITTQSTVASEINAGLTFESDVANAQLRIDERRITQVLLILIDNSLRYGGSITSVQVMSSTTGYRISVSDNGAGIPDEEVQMLFTRFYRGSNASARYPAGAGLGLPVAKSIVEAHGGRISASSEPGHGVTVEFTLPGTPVLKAVS